MSPTPVSELALMARGATRALYVAHIRRQPRVAVSHGACWRRQSRDAGVERHVRWLSRRAEAASMRRRSRSRGTCRPSARTSRGVEPVVFAFASAPGRCPSAAPAQARGRSITPVMLKRLISRLRAGTVISGLWGSSSRGVATEKNAPRAGVTHPAMVPADITSRKVRSRPPGASTASLGSAPLAGGPSSEPEALWRKQRRRRGLALAAKW